MSATSSWGTNIKLSIFGESHGPAIGRRAGRSSRRRSPLYGGYRGPNGPPGSGREQSSTPRKEADTPRFASGVLDNHTTGAPLCILIENTNTRSQDYANLALVPRPGHADYTAFLRYGGHNDVRGGGHFSGRLTACLCAAGAVCRQILLQRGVHIGGHVLSVGSSFDEAFPEVEIPSSLLDRLSREYFPVIRPDAETQMRAVIEEARMARNSVGGTVEIAVSGFPAGIGGPLFGGVEPYSPPSCLGFLL